MKNKFKKEYDEKEHKAYIETLSEYAREKSYFEKRRNLFRATNLSSFVFSFLSVITMAFAAYSIAEFVSDGNIWVAGVASVVFLLGLEYFKRLSSNEFFEIRNFQNRFAVSWFTFSVLLFLTSAIGSAFGAKEGTNTLAPSIDLVLQDSTLTAVKNRIAELEAENKVLEANKNSQGITFVYSQDSKRTNKKIIAQLTTQQIELENELKGQGKSLTKDYKAKVNFTGWVLMIFSFICEVLFQCCIAYVWHYRKRVYAERGAIEKTTNGNADNASNNAITKKTTHNDNAVLNATTKPITATLPIRNDNESNVIKNAANVVITGTSSNDNVMTTPNNAYPLSLRQRKEFATTDSYIDYLLDMRSAKQRTYNSHKSKKKNGKGNAVTNQKAMNRNESHIHQIDLLLAVEKSIKQT